uniref:Uncharacterized protein n=1 Tax=Cacopsylla melanoneura TaxID=428564 RepID=A0A8D8UYN3_9HEMI
MFYLNIFLVYLLSSVSALLPGDTRFNPHCEIPALDQVDVEIDMLGDREKNNICSLPRPTDLCPKGKGPADEFCKKIARAAGGTSNAKCLRKRTCSFQVNKPFRHPSRPGAAYVSLCKGKRDGVIFPCRENNLNIVDPDYNDFEEEDEDEAPVASPNWVRSERISQNDSDTFGHQPVWNSGRINQGIQNHCYKGCGRRANGAGSVSLAGGALQKTC